LGNTSEETKMKVEKIKANRQLMKELGEEVRLKDEKYRELLQEYSKLQKDVTRSHYTDRILEGVKNVKKQKVDIDKVLLEIRSLHKEINSTNATLSRTFMEIDELVFQDAKKDVNAKEAYKQIVSMNDNFKKLIECVEEVGSTQNAILTLESKLKQMVDRTNAYDFERIEQDLKEMKQENLTLLGQLQQKQ